MKLFERKIIRGCEARGDAESAYMTRITIVGFSFGQLCLHFFHRSDADELHDHPWAFWTLPIWRGYSEHTSSGVRRIWPFTIHRRRATHSHRVELIGGKSAVTLVWMQPRTRTWGFFTSQGWKNWRLYFREKGCL